MWCSEKDAYTIYGMCIFHGFTAYFSQETGFDISVETIYMKSQSLCAREK